MDELKYANNVKDYITKGKWVSIIQEIPVENAPPLLSIHYAVPWINEDWVESVFRDFSFGNIELVINGGNFSDSDNMSYKQKQDMLDKKSYKQKQDILEKEPVLLPDMWGATSNPVYDVAIKYNNEHIRIHGYEYKEVTLNHFKEVFPEAYEFIPLPETELSFGSVKLSKEKKIIYEQALIDGCNEYEAMQVVYGRAIQEFPMPVGWYRLKEGYAKYFRRV